MDEQTLVRATEPFFTTKGVGKGTGLGLSMVKGMVEQSGGQFVIRSAKGEGTTVEIWLPATVRGHHVAPLRSDRQEAEDEDQEGRAVILAVDDDPLVLENVADMLEDLGYRVLTAVSGADALKILTGDEPVDLVVTDQIMPHMTGLQLIEEIRSLRPKMPSLLASGYAELSPNAQLEGRLTKPFQQKELASAVALALTYADM